ncbi:SixA phosphatase family protein [Mucilaginibacter sp.]
MKRLLLIRHAKAEQGSNSADFDRPLTQSGMQDAAVMAQRLVAKGYKPELIISSPALRTHTTANIFSEHLLSHEVETDIKIYDASENTLLHIINNLPDDRDFIAIVGHNPGISQILYYLTGKIKDVPTCAIAVIEFDEDDWKTLSMEMGDLIYYDEVK